MKKSRRETGSDNFPLTSHPKGQYCKKIKGKILYIVSIYLSGGFARLDKCVC